LEPQGRKRGRAFVVLGNKDARYTFRLQTHTLCVTFSCGDDMPYAYIATSNMARLNICKLRAAWPATIVAGRAALSNSYSYCRYSAFTVYETVDTVPFRWN